jgi:hypothetical protein
VVKTFLSGASPTVTEGHRVTRLSPCSAANFSRSTLDTGYAWEPQAYVHMPQA